MALFDFLKKKEKKEKEAQKSPEVSAVAEREQKYAHEDGVEHAPEKSRVEISGAAVLVAPHVTERARDLSTIGQYTFRVASGATKQQIADAVRRTYGVHVERVHILAGQEKPRRRGLTWGTKKGYKKAVVALRNGEAIDIF